MPEVTTETFNLADATPGDLEQRRRAIVESLTTDYKGYDDPEVPITLLQELCAITAALRRKTAGPPRVTKPRSTGKVASVDDMML